MNGYLYGERRAPFLLGRTPAEISWGIKSEPNLAAQSDSASNAVRRKATVRERVYTYICYWKINFRAVGIYFMTVLAIYILYVAFRPYTLTLLNK